MEDRSGQNYLIFSYVYLILCHSFLILRLRELILWHVYSIF